MQILNRLCLGINIHVAIHIRSFLPPNHLQQMHLPFQRTVTSQPQFLRFQITRQIQIPRCHLFRAQTHTDIHFLGRPSLRFPFTDSSFADRDSFVKNRGGRIAKFEFAEVGVFDGNLGV